MDLIISEYKLDGIKNTFEFCVSSLENSTWNFLLEILLSLFSKSAEFHQNRRVWIRYVPV